jgi:hypothetical protein
MWLVSRCGNRAEFIQLISDIDGWDEREWAGVIGDMLPQELRERAVQFWNCRPQTCRPHFSSGNWAEHYCRQLRLPLSDMVVPWQQRGYWLETEEGFQTVRTMWQEGRIKAVSGNLGGGCLERIYDTLGKVGILSL